MGQLVGASRPNINIRFKPVGSNASLLKGLESIVRTDTAGLYSAFIANGVYNVNVGNREYKNVVINADGSLNDFLGDANGRNM